MDSGIQEQSARRANTPLPPSYRLALVGFFLGGGLALCFLLILTCLPFLPVESERDVVVLIIAALLIVFLFLLIGSFWLLLRAVRDRLRALGFEAMAETQPWILCNEIGRDFFRDPRRVSANAWPIQKKETSACL